MYMVLGNWEISWKLSCSVTYKVTGSVLGNGSGSSLDIEISKTLMIGLFIVSHIQVRDVTNDGPGQGI